MSTDCTFFDPATGAITMVASLSNDTLMLNADTGANFLVQTCGDRESQYVINGALVDFTPEELAAKRSMPKGWIWKMPERVAVDMRVLADILAPALAKPYADIDAVVRDAVGNRTEEYKDAEADARAYKAAGYIGTIPPSVNCYAQHNLTGSAQTGQWAADDIIARADAFSAAKLSMRESRFASQFAMRAATTNAELDAAVAAWNSFIAQIRAQLGL